eukprot:6088994-Prymnesium_polylepis.1
MTRFSGQADEEDVRLAKFGRGLPIEIRLGARMASVGLGEVIRTWSEQQKQSDQGVPKAAFRTYVRKLGLEADNRGTFPHPQCPVGL